MTLRLSSFTAVLLAMFGTNTSLAALQPTLNFAQQVIPVGKGPGFVAIADLNHDANPDIVVANEDEGTVSVLLSDGKGRFTPAARAPFPCNSNPYDIAVVDMNGDGNPDLVIANHQTPYVTVLLGDGKGGFTPAPKSPFRTTSDPHPHGVAVGDFTGDGKPAVVTDSRGDGRILLIPSDGHGNLVLPGTFFETASGYSDSGVRAADFNHDGHLDIVTSGHHNNEVGLLLGDGKGGFHPAPASPFLAGGNSWSFAIGDINGDGNLDIVTIPYEPDLRDPDKLVVTVLLGDGQGSFKTMPGPFLSLAGCHGPNRVAAGNVAGNGPHDIVVSCAQNDRLAFFLAQKDGSFIAASRTVSTGWGGLAVGGLTPHGKAGVVVANHAAGAITVLVSR